MNLRKHCSVRLKKKDTVLYIVGTQSDLNRYNQWNPGLKIVTGKPCLMKRPGREPGFTAFSLSDNTKAWLSDCHR